jgi:hypothetical protein
MKALFLAALVACGPDLSRPGGGGGDGDGGVSGGPNAVTCSSEVETMTAATGGKNVLTNYFAVVGDVHRGDSFAVEQCDNVIEPAPSACPNGYSCSFTGTRQPTGTTCYRSSAGTFVNDLLVINCGYAIDSYDANGTATSHSANRWMSIRVYR